MLKPVQARMARAALGWSLVEIQEKTGINKNTVVRFESGRGVLLTTAARLENVFVRAGIAFIYEDDTRGPGVSLSKELSRRLAQLPEPKAKPSRRKSRPAAK
jgi:transcriptional regulator with XRE-family HTH domain